MSTHTRVHTGPILMMSALGRLVGGFKRLKKTKPVDLSYFLASITAQGPMCRKKKKLTLPNVFSKHL